MGTYLNNNFKLKTFSSPKNDKKLIIETYLQKNRENKKNNFDGVCLNNMILEDIKDQLKFSFNDEKIIKRNKAQKFKMFLSSDKFENSIKKYQNKKTKEKETEKSLSLKYLKTTPLFKSKKDKIDKKTDINNNLDNYKRILMLKQSIEADKINYDAERNKYYKKTISKRLNFFFGKKKNY